MSALLIASCGSKDSNSQEVQPSGTAAASAEAGAAPDGTPATAPTAQALPGMVGPEQTPAGYIYEDFYKLFGTDSSSEQPVVTPEQCAPLAFDTVTFMIWGAVPQDQAKVALYSKNDGSMILVRVSNAPENVPTSGCDKITREAKSDVMPSTTTYALHPINLPIERADSTFSVEQAVEKMEIAGAPVQTGKVGDKKTLTFSQVAGKTVQAVGFGTATSDEVAHLAQQQIDLLKN